MVFDLYLKLVMDDIVIDILNWFVYQVVVLCDDDVFDVQVGVVYDELLVFDMIVVVVLVFVLKDVVKLVVKFDMIIMVSVMLLKFVLKLVVFVVKLVVLKFVFVIVVNVSVVSLDSGDVLLLVLLVGVCFVVQFGLFKDDVMVCLWVIKLKLVGVFVYVEYCKQVDGSMVILLCVGLFVD